MISQETLDALHRAIGFVLMSGYLIAYVFNI